MARTDGVKACWIGGARYTQPLSATNAARWQALNSLGVLYVIGFAPGLRPRQFRQYAHFYLLPQLPVSVLRYVFMTVFAPVVALWLVFRHDVQVLVSQSPYEGTAAALAKNLAGLLGKRVALIVESHGDFEGGLFMYRKIPLAGLYRRIMHWSAGYSLSEADLLRAVSSTTHAQLQRWQPDKPIAQFTAWTHAETFLNIPRDMLPSQSWDVVYAGSLIPLKGIHLLIEAFSQVTADIPLSRLWIVGKFLNVDYAAQLRDQVATLNLEDRIRLTGEVSQAELSNYMRRARVVALPSSSEGMPRVIIEAMMCGTPVIATCVGGIPDVIENEVSGYLIPPENVPALTGALRRIFRDSDVDAMGQRGRELAEQLFSTASFVDGYRRMFQVVLSNEPGTIDR